jgi:hypothetical protein
MEADHKMARARCDNSLLKVEKKEEEKEEEKEDV